MNYIRIKDAPEHFNVSRATIWRWRKQKKIKVFKIGSVKYVDTNAFQNEEQD